MAYRLEPHVAGQLGEGTELDPSQHPPVVTAVEYVLDSDDADDLIESFPVFLVSVPLAESLEAAGVTGLSFGIATIRLSDECLAANPRASRSQYRWMRLSTDSAADAWLDGENRLCVSDRTMEALRPYRMSRCTVEAI